MLRKLDMFMIMLPKILRIVFNTLCAENALSIVRKQLIRPILIKVNKTLCCSLYPKRLG